MLIVNVCGCQWFNFMKVKDLLKEIERCQKEYSDFLEWDVYTEQIDEIDKECKKGKGFGGGWKTVINSEDWEYFDCAGFWTKFPDKKIFTINVNY